MKELGLVRNDGKVTFGQSYGMCDQVSYLLGRQAIFNLIRYTTKHSNMKILP